MPLQKDDLLMKHASNYFIAVIFTIFVLAATVFASTPTWSSGLSLTPNAAKNITSISATINYSNPGDLNAVCFSTTDNNSSVNCYETNQASGFALPLTSILTGISSDGNYTLFAFLRGSDFNYSFSSSAQLIIDNSPPSLNASYPANNGDFSSFTLDFNITDSLSEVQTPVIKLDSVGQTVGIPTLISNGKEFKVTGVTGLSEGSHTITVDVNDSLLNSMLTATITFRVDTTAPTATSITSSNTTSYTNSSNPTFTLNVSDSGSGMPNGQIMLSCKQLSAWYVTTYPSSGNTISDFNVLSSSYDCNTSDGNKIVYAKFKDKAGNWSATTVSTNVLVDRTAPSAPSGLAASSGNGQVSLSWSAPTADSTPGSGNAGYRVYKNGSLYSSPTDTNQIVTGLSNGTAYTFKVTTIDNANNESSATADLNATPSAGPAATVTILVQKNGIITSYAKSADVLNVSCSFTYTVDDAVIYYQYYNTNQSQATLTGPTDNTSSVSNNITLASGHTRVDFWCNGTQYGSTISSPTTQIYFDSTLPAINWKDANDSNSTWDGQKIIFVTASDDREIDTVEFKLNGIKMTVVQDGNKNSYNLKTTDYNNGSYTLKATAKDKAGNTTSITKTITLHNILTAAQMAEEAIAQASEKKVVIEDLIKFFATEGLAFPNELLAEKNSADQLLKDAEAIKNSDGNGAAAKANSAKEKYLEINVKASINPQQTKFYEYDANSLEAALQSIGLTPSQITEATTLIKGTNVERKLVMVKVGDDANAGYQAKIEITFTSDSNDAILKIVEVIPKEFVQSAAKIISDYNFTIIQNDPIIEFSVPVSNGKSVKLTYGIGNITKEQADALVSNNVIAKFSGPPIVLSEDTDIQGTLGGFAFPDISGMLVWILIILVALIAVGAVVFVLMKKNGGSSLGKDGSIIEKVSDKIVLPENKQSKETKIWEHK
jgi:hypothetical protein